MAQEVPNTEEGVANLALSLLRESPIALLTDDNPRAKRCRQWFGIARDEALRAKHWNFAQAFATPSVQTVESPGALKKRYVLPDDCVAVRAVDGLKTDEWALENAIVSISGADVAANVLVCNIDAPNISYTRRVTDMRLWDPQAKIALAEQLAVYMAPAFGKSIDDVRKMGSAAEDKLDKAANTDAREKAPTEISRSTSWTRARTGRGWRRGG